MRGLWSRMWAGRRLESELVSAYDLIHRTWKRRGPRTPPYASCYNIPKHWLEGEVGGHVVTFWGRFGGGVFTGEVMVGAFDAWWNHTIARGDGGLVRDSAAGSPEARLAALPRLEELMADNSQLRRVGISFKGLNLELDKAPAGLVHATLEGCVAVVDELVARQEPALLRAVTAGDLKRAADLLADGADPDEYGPEPVTCSDNPPRQVRRTPLVTAILNDDAAMVRLLLFEGADVTTNPALVLWAALQSANNRALEALLQNGLELPSFGLPFDLGLPLEFAASRGDPEAVRILLEAGADPEDTSGLLSARQQAAGPHKDEIRRLIDRALAAREDVRGRLSLTSEDSGGQLSLAHRGEGGEVSLSDQTEDRSQPSQSDE